MDDRNDLNEEMEPEIPEETIPPEPDDAPPKKASKPITSAMGRRYDLTEKGKVRESQVNYEIMLEDEYEWRGKLKFNELTSKVEFDGKTITDLDFYRISSWASHRFRIIGSARTVRDAAVHVVAHKSSYDPLKDFINNLPEWDNTPRMGKALHNWCGCENTAYTRWVSRMLLVQMIARALEPACQARYVTVLEGPEQLGKTEFVLILGGDWAGTLEMTMDSKEAHMVVAGKWVVELAELSTLRKSSIERIKAFISARHDAYVPKFSNNEIHLPRRCVFIGTTNDKDYLLASAEHKRFLPVEVHLIRHEKVREEREQALAEARAWWQEHYNDWWYPPEEVEKMWQAMREDRRDMNSYEEKLSGWLDEPNQLANNITWPYIAKHFLGVDNKEMANKGMQAEVTTALKRLGWVRGPQQKTKEGTVRIWQRPKLGAVSTEEVGAAGDDDYPSYYDNIDPTYDD